MGKGVHRRKRDFQDSLHDRGFHKKNGFILKPVHLIYCEVICATSPVIVIDTSDHWFIKSGILPQGRGEEIHNAPNQVGLQMIAACSHMHRLYKDFRPQFPLAQKPYFMC